MKKCTVTMNSLMLILAIAVLLLTGCVNTTISQQDTLPADESALPPVSGFADDIQDIVIPTDMEWNRDESMAIKTESFRGGLWQYSGKVEIISLKDFMASSMQDNKWKLVGEVSVRSVSGRPNTLGSSQPIVASVKPVKVDATSFLGSIIGAENGLVITTDTLGDVCIQGPGAGGKETAFGILSDILSLI